MCTCPVFLGPHNTPLCVLIKYTPIHWLYQIKLSNLTHHVTIFLQSCYYSKTSYSNNNSQESVQNYTWMLLFKFLSFLVTILDSKTFFLPWSFYGAASILQFICYWLNLYKTEQAYNFEKYCILSIYKYYHNCLRALHRWKEDKQVC